MVRVGGPVDRCTVSLRLFSDDLDPAAISALLHAQPTMSHRKGDVLRSKRGDRVCKRGRWILRCEGDPGATLAELIDQLLDQLTPELAAWSSLSARCDMDLFCGLFLEEENRGLTLPASTLQRLAERGLALGLDIYTTPEDDRADAECAECVTEPSSHPSANESGSGPTSEP